MVQGYTYALSEADSGSGVEMGSDMAKVPRVQGLGLIKLNSAEYRKIRPRRLDTQ